MSSCVTRVTTKHASPYACIDKQPEAVDKGRTILTGRLRNVRNHGGSRKTAEVAMC